MRIFITGATGFAGSHLVDLLLEQDHQLFALVHDDTSHQSLPDTDQIVAVTGNLMDKDATTQAVLKAEPELIFHLAGQASPAMSWQEPTFTMAINSGGTANILHAAKNAGKPRTVIVTTADVYGYLGEKDLPITEEVTPVPRNPYAVSKLSASMLGEVYWRVQGVPVIEARPFNHIGPRQALGFVVPDFASQLAAIKLGKREPKLSVGNLEAQRDFCDVRDVARAYWALAEEGEPGEQYLICSGRPTPINEILETLVDLSGMDVDIQQDPGRMRPSDEPCLYGSFSKIQEQAGWLPQITLQQSLSDALDNWVVRISSD